MTEPFAIEILDPRLLRAHPQNFRRHPEAQRTALGESIAEHGWLSAPIWNRRTGHVLDGHARVEMAVSTGEALIPVRVLDVSERQERRILASFDRIGELRERDDAALAALLADLSEDGGLPAGWSDDDLNALLADVSGTGGGLLPGADPDAIPEAVETRCQPGDLWRLGAHRLLCGDSTKAEDVGRLMARAARCMVFITDPPYAVDYVEKARDMNRRGYGHSRGKSAAAIQGDGIEGGQEDILWRGAFETGYEGAVREDAAFYCWHAQGRAMLKMYSLLEEMGFLHHQTLIWVKTNFVIGRCDYQWKHEPCFYGWKQGHRPPFLGEKNQTTVVELARDNQTPLHPTQKPVRIFADWICNHARPTDGVYDPFAGSGTTLIACEQTGRAARCLEIEPRYVDVILARFEQATGQTAERID